FHLAGKKPRGATHRQQRLFRPALLLELQCAPELLFRFLPLMLGNGGLGPVRGRAGQTEKQRENDETTLHWERLLYPQSERSAARILRRLPKFRGLGPPIRFAQKSNFHH